MVRLKSIFRNVLKVAYSVGFGHMSNTWLHTKQPTHACEDTFVSTYIERKRLVKGETSFAECNKTDAKKYCITFSRILFSLLWHKSGTPCQDWAHYYWMNDLQDLRVNYCSTVSSLETLWLWFFFFKLNKILIFFFFFTMLSIF